MKTRKDLIYDFEDKIEEQTRLEIKKIVENVITKPMTIKEIFEKSNGFFDTPQSLAYWLDAYGWEYGAKHQEVEREVQVIQTKTYQGYAPRD